MADESDVREGSFLTLLGRGQWVVMGISSVKLWWKSLFSSRACTSIMFTLRTCESVTNELRGHWFSVGLISLVWLQDKRLMISALGYNEANFKSRLALVYSTLTATTVRPIISHETHACGNLPVMLLVFSPLLFLTDCLEKKITIE